MVNDLNNNSPDTLIDVSNLDEKEQENLDQINSSTENYEESDIDESSTEKEISEVVNCLALTVKKDYNLSIVKNVVVKSLKSFWKIAVSIFTLNLLKFFL